MAAEKMRGVSRYQKVVISLTGLAAMILVLGWSLPEPGDAQADWATGPDLIQACTEIGCSSGIYFNLAAVRRAVPEAKRIEVCVNGKCRISRINRRGFQSFELRTAKLGPEARVRLILRDAAGEVLRRQKFTAPVARLQPNGDNCPPVCFQVLVRVSQSDGRLVPRPAPAPQA